MKEFFATDVFHSGSQLQLLVQVFNPKPKPEYDTMAPIDEEWRSILLARYGEMSSFCEVFELPVAEDSRKEIVELLEKGAPRLNRLHPLMEEFRQRIQAELKSKLCLHLPLDRTQFYQEPFRGWSLTLANYQSQVGFDIEEGSKCLATARNTACVFHMMRVVEVGLKTVTTALGITLDWHERSWEKMLTKIQDEITKRNKSGDPAWAAKRTFFEEVYGLLNAVRIAWRNPGLHVDKQYDSERAEHIYRMVRDFMEHLSLHQLPDYLQ